jgi:regulator of sigma E protease
MTPSRFYIGFPPAIYKVMRNGIEYGIGAIPLGGFVKIPGMHRPAPSDLDMHFGSAVEEAPELAAPEERLRRRLIDGEFDEARTAVDDLEWSIDHASLSPGSRKEAERGVRDIRETLGRNAYWRHPAWKRVTVILAGPAMNILFAILLFAGLSMAGGVTATRTVGAIQQGHPAASVGLRPGDVIVAVNGRNVTPEGIRSTIADSGGRPLTVMVNRHGRLVSLGPISATKEDGVFRLGFALRGKPLGFGPALWSSVKLTGSVTKQIGASLGNLVHGKGRKNISSPVGIVQGSSTALHHGFQDYLWVLGLISLSLALLNLLPFLPLDGGHIVFSIIEGVRGKAIRREIYERASAVGIALVLLLFFVGLSNDIHRIGG